MRALKKHQSDLVLTQTYLKFSSPQLNFLSYLYKWNKNSQENENQTVYKQGKYWFYRSQAEISEDTGIPLKSVERLLKQLQEKGVIEKGNFNNFKANQKKWYRISDNAPAFLLHFLDRVSGVPSMWRNQEIDIDSICKAVNEYNDNRYHYLFRDTANVTVLSIPNNSDLIERFDQYSREELITFFLLKYYQNRDEIPQKSEVIETSIYWELLSVDERKRAIQSIENYHYRYSYQIRADKYLSSKMFEQVLEYYGSSVNYGIKVR